MGLTKFVYKIILFKFKLFFNIFELFGYPLISDSMNITTSLSEILNILPKMLMINLGIYFSKLSPINICENNIDANIVGIRVYIHMFRDLLKSFIIIFELDSKYISKIKNNIIKIKLKIFFIRIPL